MPALKIVGWIILGYNAVTFLAWLFCLYKDATSAQKSNKFALLVVSYFWPILILAAWYHLRDMVERRRTRGIVE